MRVSYAARTDLGRQRTNNEDNFLLLADQKLFVVADGMGGHASGEVASLVAVQAMQRYFVDTAMHPPATWPFELSPELTAGEKRLTTGVKLANLKVHEAAAQGGRFQGMGTTMVALHLGEANAGLAHVGDSRAYRLFNGVIEQITEDHSLLNEYLKLNRLRREDVPNFTHKNVIIRALGLGPSVDVDLRRMCPVPGETYLMCSDGLTDMVSDADILQLVTLAAGDLDKAGYLLIETANDNGGADNVTVVLVSFAA